MNESDRLKILNYNPDEEVMAFKKLEIGVSLPGNVQQKVTHFVKNLAVPNEQKLNPYLEWELRVFTLFVHKESGDTITIDGFYTQEYSVYSKDPLPKPRNQDSYTDEEYKNLGTYTERPSFYPFRIRFAPPKNGNWTAITKCIVMEEDSLDLGTLDFVVRSGQDGGYITVSKNNRYLSQGSRTFYPLGFNLPWPETDSLSDPDLYNNLCYIDKSSGRYFVSSEGYRTHFVAPRVQERYRTQLRKMDMNGMNYFRMIMYPTASEIEWEKIGDYTARLPLANELDKTLQVAEDLDMYIQWNLQIHYSFQLKEFAYYRSWTWNWEHDGSGYCYKQLIGSEDPVDFFRSEEAKKYYKQRLRYILARWGYSTHIAVFEMFSEISNVGTAQADNAIFYKEGDNWKIFSDWQKEMAAYIKSQYNGKIHLLTASFAGPKDGRDDIFVDGNLDLMTSNIYDFGPQDFASFYSRFVSRHFLNSNRNQFPNTDSYIHQALENNTDTLICKPMIFAETDPLLVTRDKLGIELRRGAWQSVFSGLAGALSWETRTNPSIYPMYRQIGDFIEQFDLGNDNWIPAASEIDTAGNWLFNEEFANAMDPKVKKRKKEFSALADVSYLRSSDGNFAIGVMTNKTYNVRSVENYFANLSEPWPEMYSTINVPKVVDTKKEPMRIEGLNKGKYEIRYFLTTNLKEPIAISEDRGASLKMETELGKQDVDFIVVFMANKKNYDWKLKRKLTKEEIKERKMDPEKAQLQNRQ